MAEGIPGLADHGERLKATSGRLNFANFPYSCRAMNGFFQKAAAITWVCFAGSCVSPDHTPDWVDMHELDKKRERLPDGGVALALSGYALKYPPAAVEAFHKLADKHFKNQPYSYGYEISHERAKRAVPKDDRGRIAPPPGLATMPMYPVGGYGPAGGGGGGEVVAILAAVVVVALLAKAIAGQPAPKKPKSSAPKMRGYATHVEMEEHGAPRLVLRGTARPVAPVALDRARTIQIVIPRDATFQGKTVTGSGLQAANVTAEALAGWTTEVVRSPTSRGGYLLKPSLIRWANRSDLSLNQSRDVATVEYELVDGRTSRTLRRFVVHGTEPSFTMKIGGTPADVLKPAFTKRWAVYTR